MTNGIVSLKAAREIKKAQEEFPEYSARIRRMEKLDLLNEMVSFQEERSKLGHLTASMMVRGQILFKALEENAETEALLVLTRSYRQHLEYELEDYMRTGTRNSD